MSYDECREAQNIFATAPAGGVSAANILANTDLQAGSDAIGRAFPAPAGSITFLVNFPAYAKMCLDMIKAGSGYVFNFEALVPGTDLRKHASVLHLVDVAILPKAIGGDATSVDNDGKEDETCTLGVEHPTLSAFLRRTGGEGSFLRRTGGEGSI